MQSKTLAFSILYYEAKLMICHSVGIFALTVELLQLSSIETIFYTTTTLYFNFSTTGIHKQYLIRSMCFHN